MRRPRFVPTFTFGSTLERTRAPRTLRAARRLGLFVGVGICMGEKEKPSAGGRLSLFILYFQYSKKLGPNWPNCSSFICFIFNCLDDVFTTLRLDKIPGFAQEVVQNQTAPRGHS